MRNYLHYLIKTRLLQTVVLTLIPTLIFFAYLALYYRPHPTFIKDPTVWVTPLVFFIIVIHLVVILRFSVLKSLKDVDLYYALPMSKKNLYATHYLFGLIQLFMSFTVLFFIGFITFAAVSNGKFILVYIALMYPTGLLFGFLIYTLVSFIFIKGNTLIDCIAFVALFHGTLALLPGALVLLGYRFFGDTIPFLINPFYGLFSLSNGLISIANPNQNFNYSRMHHVFNDTSLLLTLGIHLVLFMAVVLVIYIHFFKKIETMRVEKIGDISDATLGYRLYIPLLVLLSSVIGAQISDFTGLYVILLLLILTSGYIGFVIYKRTLKISKLDVVWIIVPLLVGTLFGLI